MIRPAIFGTENVLNSVNKSPSVKRVVLTASTVSVWGDPHERGKGHVFTGDKQAARFQQQFAAGCVLQGGAP